MNRALLAALAKSLILTLVLEMGFFLLTCKRNKRDLLLVGAVNIVTNPVVVLLFWLSVFHADRNRAVVMAPLELFAVCAEGYYYKKYGQDFKRPYLFSAAANAFSFGIGVLLQLFI
ncbi:MAG: hypothetical protein LBL15_01685 [Oscillospiraceae bacterium]|jgi:hypothetical protein|nr:hypothetical protein [Oscillospiraceae bacterium]